ncbi:MAG: DNA polymerase IV [Oscillospiraceae bacterium]|jgi:DNA polymerase-4|nr:DNA polymerase IV [Oscillospiraceae bacterium]
MARTILHCDLNSFYASVELLSHPELRQQPVAVCGDPDSRKGIILAKNEPAKRCGVKTAETIWQARQKCPDLVFLPPHHDQYRQFSHIINNIYGQYTDLVEPFGIDESWLDITGSMHLFGGDARAIADGIRRRISQELGLTLSIGVSFNKVFAKLGSDYRKPDATTVIPPESWQEIVWPLPLSSLLYAGPAAQRALGQYGIHTVGDLAAVDPVLPQRLLGKLGRQLWDFANGRDTAPVRPQHEKEPVKSVGNSFTFRENLISREQVLQGMSLLCDSVASRLRQQNLYCGAVQIGLRDPAFRNISRQKQLACSTHSMRDLLRTAMELADCIWKPPSPLRLLSVTALSLTDRLETYEQVSLFVPQQSAGEAKLEKLEETVDAIRKKYGGKAIAYGDTLSQAGQLRRTDEA